MAPPITTTALLSAGIDIGTTTTHLTLSRLEIGNAEAAHRVPRLCVFGKHILHRSPIHLTPLQDDGAIDGAGVAEIITEEYSNAGITAEQVVSGAAIITGESARLRNAQQVVQELARFAGDFVVASAGAHLESILAARGSGAVLYSRESLKTVCNIDVGGGTTNVAVIAMGNVVDTACIGIGGRCVRFDDEGRVAGLTESGEMFFDATAKLQYMKMREKLSHEFLELIGNLLGEAITQAVIAKNPPQVSQRLFSTDSLSHNYIIDEYWFSGGVAELMTAMPLDPLQFKDLGTYLAKGLLGAFGERNLPYQIPADSIRATVIGAGMHSMQLSGSTVSVQRESLPLRNLPVLKIQDLPRGQTGTEAFETIKSMMAQRDLDWRQEPVALCIEQLPSVAFEELRQRAAFIAQSFVRCGARPPLVILTNQDVAMALGQLIRQVDPNLQCLVLDGIATEDGDFIDVGRPLLRANTVPVVVKTLIFNS